MIILDFSDADGEQKLDGDVVRGLRERVARARLALRTGPELGDALGRSCSQVVRSSSHPSEHVPGTISGNEGKC